MKILYVVDSLEESVNTQHRLSKFLSQYDIETVEGVEAAKIRIHSNGFEVVLIDVCERSTCSRNMLRLIEAAVCHGKHVLYYTFSPLSAKMAIHYRLAGTKRSVHCLSLPHDGPVLEKTLLKLEGTKITPQEVSRSINRGRPNIIQRLTASFGSFFVI